MGDSFGAELLMNPKQSDFGATTNVGGSHEVNLADIDAINLDSMDFGSFGETSQPKLVPTFEEIGKSSSSDGFVNLNAESFLPKEPERAAAKVLSNQEILNRKRKLIAKFERRAKMGRGPTRRFTMDDNLEDMEDEDKAMANDQNFEFMVGIMEKVTIGISAAVEKGAEAMPRAGFRMKGFSQNTMDTMDEFYPVFEELIDKYAPSVSLGPEVKYLYLLGMGAYMTHMTNKMTQEFGPSMTDVLKGNPDLMKKMAEAYIDKTVSNAQSGSKPVAAAAAPKSDPLSEMAKFIGLGAPGAAPPAPRQPTPPMTRASTVAKPAAPPAAPRRDMKGPQNLDSLLKSIDLKPPMLDKASAQQPPASALKKPRSERSVKNTVSITL